MSDVKELLPTVGLPAAMKAPSNVELEWFDMDTRDAYETNGGHPLYGEHDIRYRFNSLGYRSPEPDAPAELRVLAIGCSYVLGVGLPEAHLFHHRFARRLQEHTGATVVVHNLGAPGGSNDYINRMCLLAVPYFDPHVVLIHFTHAARREYGSLQDGVMRYIPGWSPDDFVQREIKRHFDALSSGLDDCLNFFKNYRGIAAFLADRPWLFSTSDPQCLGQIVAHVDSTRYMGTLEAHDLARDHAHPGAESHADLAERYWRGYLRLGGTDVIPSRSRALSPPAITQPALSRALVAPMPRDGIAARILGFLTYIRYRLLRRARIKKAKEQDPNIYPLY